VSRRSIADRVDVACLGEALIDLVSVKAGVGLDGAPAFAKAAGGAPANVAVGVARLGRRAAFVGAVGADSLGRFLREALQRHGVDVRGLTAIVGRPTALALVSLKADGDPDFLFYGDRPAHLGLRLTVPMRAIVGQASILHYGSISFLAEPSRRATLAAIREARGAGGLCSYDPNLRLGLWSDGRTARRWLREGLRHADCVKVNAEELAFLTGQRDIGRGLRRLTEAGPALAVATLGPDGCAYRGPSGEGHVPGFAAKVVDTTGAGDAFVAGLLVGLLGVARARSRPWPPRSELEAILTLANAAAALSTERRGGIPSLPTRRRVTALLRARGGQLPARRG
jgi:sugar/nucleoside kinase (ribokinase family)